MTQAANGLSRVIFGCSGPQVTDQERALFSRVQPFGFILFARNIYNKSQLKALTSELRDAVGWPAPVFIDQEGGRVARLAGPDWQAFPPALDHAGHPDFERLFWLRGRLIAHDLLSVGIDVNCAPLADVARNETHSVLKNRCYGYDTAAVVAAARALARGHAESGVLSVLKHIPGHGRAQSDSHLGLPHVSTERAELDRIDFAAFRGLTDIEMGMTAHIVFKDIDAYHPATQSSIMVDVIRRDIGFDNLLMTDDLSMQALSGDMPTRLMASLNAGCDVGLHCNGDLDEMISISGCVPPFTGASLSRANRVLQNRPQQHNIDISALKEEFTTLLHKGG